MNINQSSSRLERNTNNGHGGLGLSDEVKRILEKPALTPKDLEIVFDRHRKTIAKGIREGGIPSFKIAGTINVPTVWVLAQLRLSNF